MEIRLAETLKEALLQDSCIYMGGGTDLMPLFKNGVRNDGNVLIVGRLPELKGISDEGDSLTIGAAETLADLAENDLIIDLFPALSAAAKAAASPQIRNIGTIAGNIMQDRRCIYFNQSELWRSALDGCFKTGGDKCQQIPSSPVCRAIYYSDAATALLLYDAEAEYYEDGTLYTCPVKDLVNRHSTANGGPCSEHLRILITRFRLKKRPAEEISGFYKYSLRSSIDFPLINFAVRFGSKMSEPKIVAGAAGPAPIELSESAGLLDDKRVSDAEAAASCAAELKKRAGIIKEDLISPARKREMFGLILLLLNELRGNDGK